MTRSLGGEQSLKAEVFDVGNGTQLGHCTIKGRSDAMKVYGSFSCRFDAGDTPAYAPRKFV
jgi:hypothetical protein